MSRPSDSPDAANLQAGELLLAGPRREIAARVQKPIHHRAPTIAVPAPMAASLRTRPTSCGPLQRHGDQACGLEDPSTS
jgi:hypothetical protein